MRLDMDYYLFGSKAFGRLSLPGQQKSDCVQASVDKFGRGIKPKNIGFGFGENIKKVGSIEGGQAANQQEMVANQESRKVKYAEEKLGGLVEHWNIVSDDDEDEFEEENAEEGEPFVVVDGINE